MDPRELFCRIRGGKFKNTIKDKVMGIFKVEQRFTSPYNPQGNGLRERRNGIISTVLGKMGLAACEGGAVKAKDAAVQAELTKWDEMLPIATYFYNAKTHSSTGFTPYEIVYVRPPITWSSLRLDDAEVPPDSLFGDNDEVAGITTLLEMRKEIRATAEKRQKQADARNKTSYDKRHCVFGSGLTVGCTVWRTDNQVTKKTSGHKLLPKWYGPYKVARLTSTTAHLQGEDGQAAKGVRFELLKKDASQSRPSTSQAKEN